MRGSALGHRRDWIAVGAGALVLALLPSPLRGEEVDEVLEEAGVPVWPGSKLVTEAGFGWQGEADIDSGGEVQVNRFDLGLGTHTGLTESLQWNNSFFFGLGDYSFEGGGLGDPWDDILNLRLGSRLAYALTEHWGISGGGVLIFSPETGADWGDSITGGGTVAAEYRHGDTLYVSLGVGVISQIEDDVAIWPAAGLNWLPHPKWAFRLGSVPASGGIGTGGEVAYRVVESLEIGVGGLYNQRRFRLDNAGVAPTPSGVGEDNSVPVRLRLGWDVFPHVSVHAIGGAVLAGELRLEDRTGALLTEQDYDPAPYAAVRVTGHF